MSDYVPTVGLEIHAELKTKTKMFCACLNDPEEKTPNKNICPVCMAHPGALPVINKEAVRKVLLTGAAIEGNLADFTEFDRKNYFYPDIPKGYQISQYKHPLVVGGKLCGVSITRVHLEEDTARSQHLPASPAGNPADRVGKSLVDFNRAGVPLMELVTEPVIHSGREAADFGRELQLLLRALDAGEANMEKGEMRVEANISISRQGLGMEHKGVTSNSGSSRSNLGLGTKVEIKNLNSFRNVERAIAYEVERQTKILKEGRKVEQETRGWDEGKQITFSQRKKENSHDYRYFPDPDLPKLIISEISDFTLEVIRRTLPELPLQKRERLTALEYLQTQDVEQLVGDLKLSQFFARAEKELKDPDLMKVAANFILNDVAGKRKGEPEWLPVFDIFIAVVKDFRAGKLPSPQAKHSILSGTMAAVMNKSDLDVIVKKVIELNPQVVADYKAGKAAALQFLVGQGMKESKNSANPQALREAVQKNLA